MRRVVAASLRLRFLVVAVAAGMMVVGSLSLRDAPVDVFPEFAPPRVEVQTAALGMTAVEVEGLVTVPLEQVLNGVARLEEMRSKSVPQLSSIELVFEPGDVNIVGDDQACRRLDDLAQTFTLSGSNLTAAVTLTGNVATITWQPPVSAGGTPVRSGARAGETSGSVTSAPYQAWSSGSWAISRP